MTTQRVSAISFLKKELKELRKREEEFEEKANLESFNPDSFELGCGEMAWICGHRAEKLEDIIEWLESRKS